MPFTLPLIEPVTGEVLPVAMVGIMDLVEQGQRDSGIQDFGQNHGFPDDRDLPATDLLQLCLPNAFSAGTPAQGGQLHQRPVSEDRHPGSRKERTRPPPAVLSCPTGPARH